MAEKKYEIIVNLSDPSTSSSACLRLRIQPDPVIELVMPPGQQHEVDIRLQTATAAFHKAAQSESGQPQAYEQILIDAASGDHALFVTSGEILASWRIIQPILDAWATRNDDLVSYKQGTVGPLTAMSAGKTNAD